MAKYNEEFKLTSNEVELIDHALGEQVNALSCGAAIRNHGDTLNYKVYKFNVRDIELIESAVRNWIGALLCSNSPSVAASAISENDGKIRQCEDLLGSLYNQKVWYGQVHHTGVPLG